jgi:hypothetical protein
MYITLIVFILLGYKGLKWVRYFHIDHKSIISRFG